jgi:TIR domain
MPDPGKRVFLSYRREVSWTLAHAVRGELVPHGFDVFLDTQSIDSGEFERVILREIESRAHFLVLLEPQSLDRIAEPGDWLRREIAHALAHRRNIVPLLANGALLPRAADLPADVARLPSFNAVSVPHEYFTAAMQRLRERFLRPPDPLPFTDLPAPVWRRAQPSALPAPTLSKSRTIRSPLVATLVWTEVDGATGYEVEQSASADFARGRRRDVAARRRHDVLPPDRDRGRFFRVRAVAFAGLSHGPWSNTIEAF